MMANAKENCGSEDVKDMRIRKRNQPDSAHYGDERGVGSDIAGIKSPIRIDLLLSIFLLILAIALADYYFRLLSYILFGTVKSGIACFLLGGAIVASSVFLLRKKISIYLPRFDVADLLFIVVFGFLFASKIVFPDWGTDTGAHEIFVQEFLFTDKLEDLKPYFLPMIAAWYGLSNRVYFYFRILLGYRLTMTVNIFIIAATYYKLKELLIHFWQNLNPDCLPSKRSAVIFGISLSAFLVLFSDFLISGMVWQQKADLMVLPLFFECLRIVFCNKKLQRYQYIFAGLLIGFSVSIKLTNAAFFIPLILYVLYRDIRVKSFKLQDYLLASGAIFLPILPFAVFGMLFTGSPVYPFYNVIFKSPYFAEWNFKDNFGPRGIIQTLLWPIRVAFDTSRYVHVSYNVPMSNGRLFIAYIVAFGTAIMFIKSRLLKERLPLMFCLISGIVIWSATAGISRYGYVSELFSIFVVVVLVFDLYKANKPILAGLCMSLIAISIAFSFIITYRVPWDYIELRPSIFTYPGDFLRDKYLPNLAMLGRDRNATDDPELRRQFSDVKTWVYLHGSGNPLTGLAVIANPYADFFWYDWTINHQQIEDKTEITKKYFENRDNSGLFTMMWMPVNSEYHEQLLFDKFLEFGFVPVNVRQVALKTVDVTQTFFLIEWELNFTQ